MVSSNMFRQNKASDLHLKQARSNEELAHVILEDGRHFDWVITVSLYSALHYTGFKIKERLPQQHPQIKRLIYEKFGSDAYSVYQTLYNKSSNARYNPQAAIKFRENNREAKTALENLGKFKKMLNI